MGCPQWTRVVHPQVSESQLCYVLARRQTRRHGMRGQDLESMGREYRATASDSNRHQPKQQRGVLAQRSVHSLRRWRGWEKRRIYDAQTGQEEPLLEGYAEEVTSIAFAPDGKCIASGSGYRGGEVRICNAQTGQEQLSVKQQFGPVHCVAFSPNGTHIAWGRGGYDEKLGRFWGDVKLCDALTGQEVHTLQGHAGSVNSVKFSPDGTRILSGSEDGTMRMWDVNACQFVYIAKANTSRVHSVVFSPDGMLIASGADDRTVRVWDAIVRLDPPTIKGHTGWVSHVAFSVDGNRIVSGSEDGTVKVWDTRTGLQILTVQAIGGPV